MENGEEFWEKLETNTENAIALLNSIKQCVNDGLTQNDRSFIENVLNKIESEEGVEALKYNGELSLVFRIMCILKAESRFYKKTLIDDCNNYDEIINKYRYCVFMIRRILMHLSDVSYDEATEYIRNNILSPYAIIFILKNERLCYDADFIVEIKTIMKSVWSISELNVIDLIV